MIKLVFSRNILGIARNLKTCRWANILACSKIIDRVLKCEKNNGYSVRNLTFHRAFDVAQDAFKAVEIIKELGFSRLLTSGQVC